MTIHSLTSGANGEGQGEIDEGFDEEFCDMEDMCLQKDSDVNNLTPSLVTLDELTDKELHHLLAEGAFNNNDDTISFPNPALLDDFDLGVDVLDSEQSTHSLLDCEPLKSPVFSNGPPCSPYHIATPSPVLVTASDFQTMTLNDCNALMVNSVAIGDNMSDFSGSPAPSCSRHCDDLDMLCSVCEDVGSLTDLPRPSLYSPPPPLAIPDDLTAAMRFADLPAVNLEQPPSLFAQPCRGGIPVLFASSCAHREVKGQNF